MNNNDQMEDRKDAEKKGTELTDERMEQVSGGHWNQSWTPPGHDINDVYVQCPHNKDHKFWVTYSGRDKVSCPYCRPIQYVDIFANQIILKPGDPY